MAKEVRVWVTKYWASGGIFQATGFVSYINNKLYFQTDNHLSGSLRLQLHKEAFTHRNEAVVHARKLRKEQIEKLREKIKKLKEMDFRKDCDIPDLTNS